MKRFETVTEAVVCLPHRGTEVRVLVFFSDDAVALRRLWGRRVDRGWTKVANEYSNGAASMQSQRGLVAPRLTLHDFGYIVKSEGVQSTADAVSRPRDGREYRRDAAEGRYGCVRWGCVLVVRRELCSEAGKTAACFSLGSCEQVEISLRGVPGAAVVEQCGVYESLADASASGVCRVSVITVDDAAYFGCEHFSASHRRFAASLDFR